jgi:prepilin-type N-terminal cleavage/methylation domain-containing protein
MNIKSNIKSHIKSNIIKQILRQNQGKYSSVDAQADPGYTLVEVLVVVVIVTTLAAIGIPSWISLLNRTAVNNAQSEMFQAISSAKDEATQKKGTWKASFRDATNANGEQTIQWAVHSGSNPSAWQTITVKGVQIDPDNTTFEKSGNFWLIKFNERGEVEVGEEESSPPVKITLLKSNSVNNKRWRCVFVRTLLGAMGTGSENECKK